MINISRIQIILQTIIMDKDSITDVLNDDTMKQLDLVIAKEVSNITKLELSTQNYNNI